MKKALIIASVASMIEQFNMNNIKLLQELGYQVDVATNFENSGNINIQRAKELIEELKIQNVNYFQIDFNRGVLSRSNLKAYKQIKHIINENNYNLIHMHSPIGGVCGRLATKKVREGGTRVVYTAHGFHFYKGAPIINWVIFYPIEKYLSKYTDYLITINVEDYNLAKKKFKKCKQIELVHGVGVDESKFNIEISTKKKHELRASLGIKYDDFVLIQVGELNKNKNQIMAINAMKKLIKENQNIHLLLIGKGDMEEEYKKKINELNLEKNIHLLGYRKDIPQLLKISNLLLSLRYREGLPVNVMEAMASGIPVVATDCRGNRDLILNGQNGYIVKTDDTVSLEEKILFLAENEKKCEQFKEKSKDLIKKYEKEEIKTRMEKIYMFLKG